MAFPDFLKKKYEFYHRKKSEQTDPDEIKNYEIFTEQQKNIYKKFEYEQLNQSQFLFLREKKKPENKTPKSTSKHFLSIQQNKIMNSSRQFNNKMKLSHSKNQSMSESLLSPLKN